MRTLGVENAQKLFKVGDLVTIDPEAYSAGAIRGVYRVRKVPVGNGYNYTCDSVLGGRGVKAAPYSMTKFDGTEADAKTWLSDGVRVLDPSEFALPPATGTVVTVKGVRTITEGVPYVVTGESRKGGAKLVRLGGDNGRYFPHIPVKYLRVLSPVEVVDAVLEHGV
jgi:hypothetical protein